MGAERKPFIAKYRLCGEECKIVVVATDAAAAWRYIEDAHHAGIQRLEITEFDPRKAA